MNDDYDLYAFDLDGTLIRSFMREGAREDYGKVELLPGREDVLTRLQSTAAMFALVTNQGGVAFGYQTAREVEEKMALVLRELHYFGGCRFSLHVAYGHHRATVEPWAEHAHVRRRKPSGVMLQEAMAGHHVEPERTLYVGDMESDREAAKNAGVAYMDAEEFFA